MNKLQAVQVAMLEQCARICEKHKIRFYLISGSALGAVRHSGFIPWDDDIDIGMPRPDYDKFLSVAQHELGSSLFLQTPETDRAYPNMYAKLRNSHTAFVESSVAHLAMNHGVYLDIFPLDGYPPRTASALITAKVVGVCLAARLRKSRCSANGIRRNTTIKTVITRCLTCLISSLLSMRQLQYVLEHLSRRHPYDGSLCVINWYRASAKPQVVPRAYFGTGEKLRFETLMVPVPSNADGYLQMIFGDYMTPPPEEQRVSHHPANIIDVTCSYEKHLGRDNCASSCN